MKDYPVIKLAGAFILGIILQQAAGIKLSVIVLILGMVFAAVIALKFFLKEKQSVILQTGILFCFILSGAGYCSFRYHPVSYPFSNPKISNTIVYGKISNIDLFNPDKITFTATTDSVIIGTNHIPLVIDVNLSVYDSTYKLLNKYSTIRVGNKFRAEGTFHKARGIRNPDDFDYYQYLQRKGVAALLTLYNSDDFKIIDTKRNILADAIFQARKSIDFQLRKYYPDYAYPLVRGVFLGDKKLIDDDLRDNFINAGVIHVLAVSGLHVGYIILIIFLIFNRVNIKLKYGLVFAGLACYLALTGFQPSVFRAVIMAAVILLGNLTNRNSNAVNSLFLAGLILLLINPVTLFAPGFQLSFSAVLSILIFYPKFQEGIEKLPINSKLIKNLLLFISVTLAAQIGTLPFTLMYFHKLSIISLAANLVVIPLIGVILAVTIITVIVSLISGWIAVIFAAANDSFILLLYWIVNRLGGASYSFLKINSFSLYDAVLFYLLLIAFVKSIKKFEHRIAKFAVLLLFCGIFFVLSGFDNHEFLPGNQLSVYTIDVGEGDAALIQFPDNETALIDAGNASVYFDNGKSTIMPLLDYLSIDKIDYAFISHVNIDHYGGFLALINAGKIKNIYKPKIDSAIANDIKLEGYIRKHAIPIKYYGLDTLMFGESRVYVLTDTLEKGYNSFNTNNKSGLLKIVYGNTSFLFTGDMEKKAESIYGNSYADFLQSNVLKVAHHGSKTSTSDEFLDLVKPEYAVISDGVGNRYHHPSPEVIRRLDEHKIKIFRTDLLGGILIVSDGKKVKMIDWQKTFKGSIFR